MQAGEAEVPLGFPLKDEENKQMDLCYYRSGDWYNVYAQRPGATSEMFKQTKKIRKRYAYHMKGGCEGKQDHIMFFLALIVMFLMNVCDSRSLFSAQTQISQHMNDLNE
jgi:hypothetical protein